MRFEYVKIDSGSVYNDLQLWSDMLGAAGSPIVIAAWLAAVEDEGFC